MPRRWRWPRSRRRGGSGAGRRHGPHGRAGRSGPRAGPAEREPRSRPSSRAPTRFSTSSPPTQSTANSPRRPPPTRRPANSTPFPLRGWPGADRPCRGLDYRLCLAPVGLEETGATATRFRRRQGGGGHDPPDLLRLASFRGSAPLYPEQACSGRRCRAGPPSRHRLRRGPCARAVDPRRTVPWRHLRRRCRGTLQAGPHMPWPWAAVWDQ